MQKTTLGRTRLEVTVAGLGTGGHSRLGIAKQGQAHAAKIVRAAYDAGVNFFDSSSVYGTEEALGEGLEGIARDRYVLSTKTPYKDKEGKLYTPEAFAKALDDSLRKLRTDYVDVYHFHALTADDYAATRDALMPCMLKAKQAGKLRFIGATELFSADTSHEMFKVALPENLLDVIMVGYNLLNPSADRLIFPLTRQNDVGVLCMFAVRTALSDPEHLKKALRNIISHGQADPSALPMEGALDFLTQGGVANSVMEAAYRFCRHNEDIDVTLTGTGSFEHLEDNLHSLQLPPLPEDTLQRLLTLFGNVDCESGE